MDDENIGIEEEFRKSWDRIEGSFLEHYSLSDKNIHPLVVLFREMRSLGYDEWFYAHESMNSLVISRSLQYGHRAGQSGIAFFTTGNELLCAQAVIAGKTYHLKLKEASISSELKLLLDMLMTVPLD